MKPDLKDSGEDGRRRARGPLWFIAGAVVAVVFVVAFPEIRHAFRHAETSAAKQAGELKERLIQKTQKPASAKTSSSGFDFYRLLSHPTQILTPGESDEVKSPPTASVAVTQPGAYVLQVASLRNAKDAEALKARLALWGVEAQVQRVDVQGETWHRVRIGPIKDLQTLNALREKLDAHKLHPLLIRVGN